MDEIQKIKEQVKTYVKVFFSPVNDHRIHNVDDNPVFPCLTCFMKPSRTV